MDASLSSVSLLPRERIAAITCDRFLLLKTSATRQYYQMQIRTSLSNFASYFLEKRGYVLGFSQLSVGGKDHSPRLAGPEINQLHNWGQLLRKPKVNTILLSLCHGCGPILGQQCPRGSSLLTASGLNLT
jgi:hypothetical protein